jgi:hypothetical protein
VLVNFKFWYKDGTGREEDIQKEVDYIPDSILYKGYWWNKADSVYDLDTNELTKVHYIQKITFKDIDKPIRPKIREVYEGFSIKEIE